MNPIEQAAEAMIAKYRKLIETTDVCFANTPKQNDECQKVCDGHGCPHWETYAKQCAIIECQSIIDELEAIKNRFHLLRYITVPTHIEARIKHYESIKTHLTTKI